MIRDWMVEGVHYAHGVKRARRLFHKDKETDDGWKPTYGSVIKLLLSIRIAGALWSIVNDNDETKDHWEPLYDMLFHNRPPAVQYNQTSLVNMQSFMLNSLFYIPGHFYLHALNQSGIALFTMIRLTIGLACIAGEYYAFDVISERVNISTGRYFLLFSTFSSGMFHASVSFSSYTVSMICSFFFLGGLLDDERWICYISWIISVCLGNLLTFVFFGVTFFTALVWNCTLNKRWIGTYLILSFVVCAGLSCGGFFYDDLPVYLRTMSPIQSIHLWLSSLKFGSYPPGTTALYFIQDFICNWNIAALLALLGPILTCITCVRYQKQRETWKKFNDPSPILFLVTNNVIWFYMLLFLRRHESFVFPMYPSISLFAALACDSIPRLWHKEDPEPVIMLDKHRQPITDPFLFRPRNKGHILVYALIGIFLFCSLLRINTVYQGYGSEMDIYKGLHAELDSFEDLKRFNEPIKLCLGKASKRFPSSFFLTPAVYDRKNQVRNVETQLIDTDQMSILSDSFRERNQSQSTYDDMKKNDQSLRETPGFVNLESCDYFIDIDKPSTALDPDFREMSDKWKPIISLPYLDAERTPAAFRFFSIPYVSSYFELTHVTTISLYRRYM